MTATLEAALRIPTSKIKILIQDQKLDDAAYELYKALFKQILAIDFTETYIDEKDRQKITKKACSDIFNPLIEYAKECDVQDIDYALHRVCRPAFWHLTSTFLESHTNKKNTPTWTIRDEHKPVKAIYKEYLREFKQYETYIITNLKKATGQQNI